jgi:pimeloyl-ACP methyl ester carboxylesterase
MLRSGTVPHPPKALTRTALALTMLCGFILAAAFVMILWNDPQFEKPPDVSPQALAEAGISFEQPYRSAARTFRMPDGTKLASQYLAAPAAGPRTPTLLLVHGLLGSGFLLNRASGLLREATGAEVVAIDLRGHGGSGGRPGDVRYVGQYEDDLGEVVRQLRAARPGGRVILAGHSMGGGIALRYAGRAGLPPVDGYLLFAPYLGWESPTTRKAPPAGGGADAGASFLEIHLPRIVGLKLLHLFGIHAFDGLRTQFFNLPPELPLRSYSYRATEDMAPADYHRAFAPVRRPLLLIVGSRDEAFVPEEYTALLHRTRPGAVRVIPGATHNGVLHDPRAVAAVWEWMGRPAS